jgi:hypothetical protein
MTNKQLQTLLSLYKKAVTKNLTAGEFEPLIREAQINIDRSFVKSGKEDENLGEYIEELIQLRQTL